MKVDFLSITGYLIGLSIISFLGIEIIFYQSWFFTHFSTELVAGDFLSNVGEKHNNDQQWPAEAKATDSLSVLLIFSIIILLLSAISTIWVYLSVRRNNQRFVLWGLFLTVVFIVLFIVLQTMEHSHASFELSLQSSNIAFLIASGRHAFSSVVGLGVFFLLLLLAVNGKWIPKIRFGFEAAIWYWQFTVFVGLALFTSHYVLGLM